MKGWGVPTFHPFMALEATIPHKSSGEVCGNSPLVPIKRMDKGSPRKGTRRISRGEGGFVRLPGPQFFEGQLHRVRCSQGSAKKFSKRFGPLPFFFE